MKNSIVCAAVLCALSVAAHATDKPHHPQPSKQAEDKWFASDKVLHAAVGAGIGAVGTAVADANGFAYPRTIGFAAGCGVGLLKEGLDKRASSKDAIVTCLAAAGGAYLGGLAIEHDRKTRTTTVSYAWEF